MHDRRLRPCPPRTLDARHTAWLDARQTASTFQRSRAEMSAGVEQQSALVCAVAPQAEEEERAERAERAELVRLPEVEEKQDQSDGGLRSILDVLAPELVLHIMSFMDVRTLGRLAQTCREMHSLPWPVVNLQGRRRAHWPGAALSDTTLLQLVARRPTCLFLPLDERAPVVSQGTALAVLGMPGLRVLSGAGPLFRALGSEDALDEAPAGSALRTLEVQGTRLRARAALHLARFISGCRQLEVLSLSLSEATASTSRALLETLRTLGSLQSLNLCRFDLSSSAARLIALATTHPTLSRLDVSLSGLKPAAVAALLEGIGAAPSSRITELDISGLCCIPQARSLPVKGTCTLQRLHLGLKIDVPAFASFFAGAVHLVELRLGSTSLSSESFVQLFRELSAACAPLECLDVHPSYLSVSAWESAAPLMLSFPSLKTLGIYDGTLTERALRAMHDEGVRFGSLKGLHTLSLVSCSISRTSFWAVAALIQSCSALRSLNVSGNEGIDVSAARKLAVALARAPQLESLTMNLLFLDDDVAEALFSRPLCQLRKVVLAKNRIGVRGARAAVRSLFATDQPNLGSSALDTLELTDNRIADPGLHCIAQALPWAPRLRVLKLSNNGISGDGCAALGEALGLQGGRALTLSEVDLSSNSFSNDAAIAIIRGIRAARRLFFLDMHGGLLDCSEEIYRVERELATATGAVVIRDGEGEMLARVQSMFPTDEHGNVMVGSWEDEEEEEGEEEDVSSEEDEEESEEEGE